MAVPFNIDLKDKVAVVTGGGGVLCGAFAKALAECGAKVAILDLRKESADTVAAEINKQGGTAIGVEANVLKLESLQTARDVIASEFGTCDILINGAGGNHPKGTTSNEEHSLEALENSEMTSFFDLDPEGIQFVFNLNFIGTLLPSQVFAKDMLGKKGASVINVSSMSAFTPLTKIPAYSGAKAAVSNFTQWLAVHFAKSGIRVNAIAPGFFETTQNAALLRDADGNYTERANKIITATPMGRFGEAEELLGTLLWLADDGASGFVNGTVIPVDGGYAAYSGV